MAATEDPYKRNESGQFGPGNKASPGGRRRLDEAAVEMLKAGVPKAIKAYIDALDASLPDGKPNHDVRLKAADGLLNRYAGKPAQAITGDDGGPLQVQAIDLDAILESLSK